MSKKRLTKCSMEYLTILFIVWQLVDYYSVLFQVDAGSNPAETITRLLEKDGITYLRLSFPKVEREPYGRRVFKMKRIYNEYLRYALLPEQDILKPFSAGSDYADIIEPLYVDMVYEDDTHINLNVIYIDNMEAYTYVRNDEIKTFREVQ